MATPTDAVPPPSPRARPTAGIERLRALYPSPEQAAVVSVIAPAGCGKTTVVLDWVSSSERPTMWLSLDGRHDDPVVLANDIARVIVAAVPEAAGPDQAIAAPAASIRSMLMPRIAAACEESMTNEERRGPPASRTPPLGVEPRWVSSGTTLGNGDGPGCQTGDSQLVNRAQHDRPWRPARP